jgi:CHAT domain-containing protein
VPALEGALLEDAARLWEASGNPERALLYYEQVLDAVQDDGLLAKRSGESRAAKAYLRRAIGVARLIGGLLFASGQHNRAIGYSRRLLDLVASYRRLDPGAASWPREQEILARAAIAHNYAEMGSRQEAAAEAGRAQELLGAAVEAKGRAAALSRLAQANAALGNLALALRQGSQALNLARTCRDRALEASSLHALGTVQARLGEARGGAGRFQEALRRHRECLSLAPSPGYRAAALGGAARALQRLGRLDKAEGVLGQSLVLSRRYGLRTQEAEAAALLGDVLRLRRRPLEAVQSYRRATALLGRMLGRVLDPELGVRFGAGHQWIYDHLADAHLDAGQRRQALEALEESRGRRLREILRAGWGGWEGALTAAERAQRQRLQDEVAQTRRLIRLQDGAGVHEEDRQTLARSLLAAEARLRGWKEARFKAYSTARTALGPVGSPAAGAALREVGDALPEGRTLAVQFSFSNERVLAFTLGRRDASPAVTRLASSPAQARQLFTLVRGYVARVAANQEDPDESSRVYRALLAPLKKQLRGAGQVVFVPDGPLWDLPFQALREPGSGRFLIEHHAVSYAPSLGVLATLSRRKPGARPRPLLAMGAFTGDGAGASPGGAARVPVSLDSRGRVDLGASLPLPGTGDELEAVRLALAQPEGAVLSGRDATESAFKRAASRSRYIHLATHAEFQEGDPLSSFVALAPEAGPAGEDGVLRLWEIAHLRPRLESDLVVLSACDTARGHAYSGEGLIGLNWALFAAGSRANMVSQWLADDRSTAQLMGVFYAGMAAGMPRARALQRAQQNLCRRYAQPYYWASFALFGAS